MEEITNYSHFPLCVKGPATCRQVSVSPVFIHVDDGGLPGRLLYSSLQYDLLTFSYLRSKWWHIAMPLISEAEYMDIMSQIFCWVFAMIRISLGSKQNWHMKDEQRVSIEPTMEYTWSGSCTFCKWLWWTWRYQKFTSCTDNVGTWHWCNPDIQFRCVLTLILHS